MEKFTRMIPVISLFLGFLLVIMSVLTGEADIALVFIFPVVYGAGIYLALGIFLIILSFPLFIFIGGYGRTEYPDNHKKDGQLPTDAQKSGSEYGGVIFIGPIPIVFGKNKSTTKKMMYLGLLIALILAAIYIAIMLM